MNFPVVRHLDFKAATLFSFAILELRTCIIESQSLHCHSCPQIFGSAAKCWCPKKGHQHVRRIPSLVNFLKYLYSEEYYRAIICCNCFFFTLLRFVLYSGIQLSDVKPKPKLTKLTNNNRCKQRIGCIFSRA